MDSVHILQGTPGSVTEAIKKLIKEKKASVKSAQSVSVPISGAHVLTTLVLSHEES
jgi:hypothetical protein